MKLGTGKDPGQEGWESRWERSKPHLFRLTLPPDLPHLGSWTESPVGRCSPTLGPTPGGEALLPSCPLYIDAGPDLEVGAHLDDPGHTVEQHVVELQET